MNSASFLPDTPLLPLHGVQLNLDKTSSFTINESLPFHLKVTIEYDNEVTIDSSAIWQMIDQGQRYSSLVELYSDNGMYTLSVDCEGKGAFTFNQEWMHIRWQSEGTNYTHYLQSLGLACWLEFRGIPCIHANAITLDENAILAIAPSRTGKSTLTSHLLQHDFKLMTDDMAAIYPSAQRADDQVKFEIYPSWPKVRLWPDMLNSLVGMEVDNLSSLKHEDVDKSLENKELKSNESFLGNQRKTPVHQKFAKYEIEFEADSKIWETTPKPLKAIYYLERLKSENSSCSISPISPSTGLMILLQNSMLADAYRSMGIEMERLACLAKITETIPIFKISYASGLDNLDNVSHKLKEHLQSLK